LWNSVQADPPAGQADWMETVLHRFQPYANNRDDCVPQSGVIIDHHGALFGTTTNGGSHGFGVVYKVEQ
jgi:hypothetical protein